MSKFEKWNLSKSTFAYWRISMCKICMLRFHHMQKEDSHPSSFRQVYLFPILRNSPAGSPYPQEPPHNPSGFSAAAPAYSDHTGTCSCSGRSGDSLWSSSSSPVPPVWAGGGTGIFWEAGTFSRRCWSRSRPDMAYSICRLYSRSLHACAMHLPPDRLLPALLHLTVQNP